MTSVISDKSPSSPVYRQGKGGPRGSNSRVNLDSYGDCGYTDANCDYSPGRAFPNVEAAGSLSAYIHEQSTYIRELEATIAALRSGQSGQYGDQMPPTRRSQFSGDPDDRARPGSFSQNSEGRVRQEQYHHNTEGWKTEIKRWKRVNNRYGSSDIYDESEKIEDIRKKEREIRSGGYVLSVYDEYDADGNKMHVLLEIHSAPLLDLLRHVITFYPGNEFDVLRGKDSTEDTVTFMAPFMMFFAYRKQLQQSVRDDFPEDAKQHVKMLLNYMKKEHPLTSAKLTEIEEGRSKKISFDKLWLLYPPKPAVYLCKGSDDRQIVVYSREVSNCNSGGPNKSIKLICWEITFEQGIFKRDFTDYSIEPYTGEKNISNLELIPIQYMKDEQLLHDELVARGRRYKELNSGTSPQDYHGDKFPRAYQDVDLPM